MRFAFLVLAFAALLFVGVGCGGGGGSSDLVSPQLPTFTADRTAPAANDIYLVGEVLDAETLLIHIQCKYEHTGPPHESVVQLMMPIASLEPLGIVVGNGWPVFSYTTPTAFIDVEPNAASTWYAGSGSFSRSDFCTFCPATYQTGVLRFATVTVRIKQHGTFRVEMTPSPRFSNFTLEWCNGCVSDSAVYETTPTYGGTVVVP